MFILETQKGMKIGRVENGSEASFFQWLIITEDDDILCNRVYEIGKLMELWRERNFITTSIQLPELPKVDDNSTFLGKKSVNFISTN